MQEFKYRKKAIPLPFRDHCTKSKMYISSKTLSKQAHDGLVRIANDIIL